MGERMTAHTEPERAAMWSAYFALRSISNPPPAFVVFQHGIRQYLRETRPEEPAPVERRRGHLTLVGGDQ